MNKQNLILVGAFALQVLVIMGMRLGTEERGAPKSAVFMEGFDADKVTELEILGAPQAEADGPPQNSVKLKKESGNWGIATADAFPADGTKVKEFLETLGKIKSRQVVVRSSAYHEKLEVSEEKYQRRVTVTQDGRTSTFFVGTSPSFKNLHVRRAGEDDVLMISDVSTGDFSDRAWGWVDRKYLEHEAKDVWALTIKNEKDTIVLEKNPQDDSWVAPGVPGPLKKSVIDDLVRKAGKMNLEEPVGKVAKPEYGLGAATVTLVTGTSTIAGVPPPTTETTTIQIGKKLAAQNRYYVKSSKNDYVVEVASWAIDPLVQKTKADLVEAPKKE